MFSILIGLIILNNVFSILIFLAEEYMSNANTEFAIDMVIVFFYLIEFAYNIATYPPPRSHFFS